MKQFFLFALANFFIIILPPLFAAAENFPFLDRTRCVHLWICACTSNRNSGFCPWTAYLSCRLSTSSLPQHPKSGAECPLSDGLRVCAGSDTIPLFGSFDISSRRLRHAAELSVPVPCSVPILSGRERNFMACHSFPKRVCLMMKSIREAMQYGFSCH